MQSDLAKALVEGEAVVRSWNSGLSRWHSLAIEVQALEVAPVEDPPMVKLATDEDCKNMQCAN